MEEGYFVCQATSETGFQYCIITDDQTCRLSGFCN